MMSFIKVDGTKIVDASGNEFILHGTGLGGWMALENYILGFPGCEFQIREALADTIGREKAEFFFEKFLEYFFAEADAIFFKSLGLNCIRVAVNYKHFQDDLNPRVLKPDCFKHLDRAISLCAKYSIYTVIDVHSAPGGQSGGWHADGGTHRGYLWTHKDFQDSFVWLWEQLATRYKDNPWIAGYNVLNEPADPHPEHKGLISLYDRLHEAIRAIDENHIIFLDGNTLATDFTKFPDDAGTRWRNTAYAIHDYAIFAQPTYQSEPYTGSQVQKEQLVKQYQQKREWMDKRGLCVWNGEWGPVYARPEYDGDATDDINAPRYAVLRDQLEIYEKDRLSWSIWLYKDIGVQGMVHVSPSTPYRRHFAKFLARKHRLAVDAWGKDDKDVQHLYQPIISLIENSVADPKYLKLYPPTWSLRERVTRISRTIMVAELMVQEWADLFKGMDEAQLEGLAQSFAFENCLKRDELNEILTAHAARVARHINLLFLSVTPDMSFIKVDGTSIVDASGNEVVLHGAGLGGWMTMENFISGYPGCEFQIREALADTIGKEKAEFFFDKFLEHFFAEPDAIFFKSLGLNCIRIAVNYRHFQDDLNPRVLKPDCFKHLDRAISLCAKHSIYTVIDVHTAPGGQSGGWHADGGTHVGYFWTHKDFQDSFVWLWEQLATHYKDNPWIAGYNVLNEPADPHPEHKGLINLYDRLHETIRAIDEKHIIFLDGNTFATDFTKFPDDAGTRWRNTAYAIHDYAVFGFPDSPEPYTGSEAQKERLVKTYQRKREWMDKHGLCVWNGEWGPVYARAEYDGDATDDINARRYAVLRDQLEIYEKDRLSWSIWLYKDIGFQGMVHVSPSTPYRRHFAQFLVRKHRLAVDAWGKDDKDVKQVYQPIISLIENSVADPKYLKLYPPLWTLPERVTRISRTIMVAEFMVQEWADMFKGMDEVQLEDLAKSFAFENCLKRDGLNKILTAHAARVASRA